MCACVCKCVSLCLCVLKDVCFTLKSYVGDNSGNAAKENNLRTMAIPIPTIYSNTDKVSIIN